MKGKERREMGRKGKGEGLVSKRKEKEEETR